MVEIKENKKGAAPSPAPPAGGAATPRAEIRARRKTGVAMLSVASNTALIVLKIAVGLLIGSVAVLSEAIHSGVDLVASLIALFAVRKASEAADERHPYGHGKFENISGTIEAVLIFVAAVWIIYAAVQQAYPAPGDRDARLGRRGHVRSRPLSTRWSPGGCSRVGRRRTPSPFRRTPGICGPTCTPLWASCSASWSSGSAG